MKFVFKHYLEFPCDQFVEIYKHNDYGDFITKNHPNLRSMKRLKVEKINNRVTYAFHIIPEVPIPKSLQKFISTEKLQFTEIASHIEGSSHFELESEMPKIDFIKVAGTSDLIPQDKNHCLRETTLNIHTSIPLFGHLLTKFFAQQLDKTYTYEAKLKSQFYREFM